MLKLSADNDQEDDTDEEEDSAPLKKKQSLSFRFKVLGDREAFLTEELSSVQKQKEELYVSSQHHSY